MTDQEYAKAVFNASRAFNDAANAARASGLKVDVSTLSYLDMALGFDIVCINVDVSRRLTNS
jgi:hypothetical protein